MAKLLCIDLGKRDRKIKEKGDNLVAIKINLVRARSVHLNVLRNHLNLDFVFIAICIGLYYTLC